jgi:cytochrome P450
MKYADVYGALRDHETFSSANNPLVGKAFPPLVLILDDPPRHTRFRRLVNKAFTLKRIEALDRQWNGVARDDVDLPGAGTAQKLAGNTGDPGR